jgi:glycosyltransferase involved in cell wall biosynthesis
VSGGGSPAPRVLLACDFHQHYCAMLGGGLARAGAAVTMLRRDHDLEFGGTAGAAEGFVRGAAGADVELRTLAGRVRSLGDWTQALALRRQLRRGESEVVHLQESIANDPRLLLAAGVRRGRFAFTVHDPVRHPGDQASWWTVRTNIALARAAGLVFVHGEALRQELIEIASPRAPIVVVPHGVDPGERVPLPGRQSILFFGRISHYKGLDVLLDAMAAVWSELPEAKLVVAGAGEIAAHPALADPRVEIHAGHIADAEVAELFKACDCIALPYRQASQSGVGSRIKPFARPLIVTDVGALPELVADGSGLVVPSEDPAALAKALVSVLSDPELATRLGDAGAATAEREGSWDVVAERTLEAYREHLGA